MRDRSRRDGGHGALRLCPPYGTISCVARRAKHPCHGSSRAHKDIPLYRNSELSYRCATSSQSEGRIATVTKRGVSGGGRGLRHASGCLAARRARSRVRQNRVVLTPGVCASSLAVICKATGAIVQRSPGRARHKPSNHCAGKAGCLAAPVCRCASVLRAFAHSGPWVPSRHPVFPAPSVPRGSKTEAKLGRKPPRGCGSVSARQVSCPGRCAALPAMRSIVRCDALQSRGPEPSHTEFAAAWVPALRSSVARCSASGTRERHITCANPLPSRPTEYFRACQGGHCGSEKRAKKKRERRPLF